MAETTSKPQKADSEKPNKTVAALAITLAVVLLLVLGFIGAGSLYTDFLWFNQLGFGEVYVTEWLSRITLFVIGFAVMAVLTWLGFYFGYVKRPVYARISSQVSRYHDIVDPVRKLVQWALPLLAGVVAGLSLTPAWKQAQLFLHASPAGVADPQFGLDVTFFMFTLPVLHGIVKFGVATVLFVALVSILTNLIYGGIQINPKNLRVSKAARVQLTVWAVLLAFLQAGNFWIQQYDRAILAKGLITGVTYSDANAVIPGLQILAIVTGLVAFAFVYTMLTGKWRLALTGTSVTVIIAVLLTFVYPVALQNLKVRPDEKSLEGQYISRNIDATRAAYGIDKVEIERYDAQTTAAPGALRGDAVSTSNIRIMDPNVIAPTFSQLEQSKQYYRFGDHLSVDRYKIDGKIEDTVSAPREIDVTQQSGWYNKSLVYTHGYGMVAAYGNQRSAGGEPVFVENGIPVKGKLGEFEPRIYFGLHSPEYSIVGGAHKQPIEVDYPADENSSSSQGNDKQNLTSFAGNGGPVLQSAFEKLLYAMKFQDMEILLSEAVVDGSQILYDRNPVTRVSKVAPYLTLDNHPYASIVDGRIVWILDGYTTSANYPYAQHTDLGDTLADAHTQNSGAGQINYIRNSVKATVDAYDGKVTLYAWDDKDPILKAWQGVYPGTLKSVSEMSSQLLSHVRYPNDLFKVQRQMLGKYHVTQADAFYSAEDAWRTPDDPTAKMPIAVNSVPSRKGQAGSVKTHDPAQPPYYLTLSAGKEQTPEFSIYSTFIPDQHGDGARDILTGYLAANANAGSTAGQISPDYGKLKLLVLPKGSSVPGPGQVQNSFRTDPNVSSVLNILERGNTDVISGNLLTLPVGGGLLYVQPVYVKAANGRGFPLLQKVLVSFGDKIAFEDTLDVALDKLFGGDSGAAAGDKNAAAKTQPVEKPAEQAKPIEPGAVKPVGDANLQQVLQAMQKAMQDRDAAMRAGDWAKYGEADNRLKELLKQALLLSGGKQ